MNPFDSFALYLCYSCISRTIAQTNGNTNGAADADDEEKADARVTNLGQKQRKVIKSSFLIVCACAVLCCRVNWRGGL